MRKAVAVLLVLVVTAPLRAQKQIKTLSPDEALKHKGERVNVCGTVRDAAPTEKGGKLYFVNAAGEAIWATPIHDLSARTNELPGAQVCAYGRTYWNLEGLGIDTERVELVATGESKTPIAASVATPALAAATTVTTNAPCRVLLTHDRADPSWYQEMQEIKFTKRRNASSDAARKELAKRAHKLGADAVIGVSLESKRTVWSFPNTILDASGKAVKWTPLGMERSYELSGSCFSVKGKEEARPTTSVEKKKFPWELVLGAAAVAAVAYGAYQFGKDDAAPATNAARPRHPTRAPTPVAEAPARRSGSSGNFTALSSAELIVLGGDNSRTFLGCLSCSEFDSASIRNDYGRHGEYGGDSIRNGYSRYGSPYAATSACNPYASQPPIIVDRAGNFYGADDEYVPSEPDADGERPGLARGSLPRSVAKSAHRQRCAEPQSRFTLGASEVRDVPRQRRGAGHVHQHQPTPPSTRQRHVDVGRAQVTREFAAEAAAGVQPQHEVRVAAREIEQGDDVAGLPIHHRQPVDRRAATGTRANR